MRTLYARGTGLVLCWGFSLTLLSPAVGQAVSIQLPQHDSFVPQSSPTEYGERMLDTPTLNRTLTVAELKHELAIREIGVRVTSNAGLSDDIVLELQGGPAEPFATRLTAALREHECTWAFRAGTLSITNETDEATIAAVQVYDVSAICAQPEDVGDIVLLIANMISPATWDEENYAVRGHVTRGRPLLTVAAPYLVHRQIRAYLQQLEELSAAGRGNSAAATNSPPAGPEPTGAVHPVPLPQPMREPEPPAGENNNTRPAGKMPGI